MEKPNTVLFSERYMQMSHTTQLDDSKQNWRGTKLKTVRQISDAL